MKYIKIQFTLGLACEAYQVIDRNMTVIDYVDLNGQHIDVPEVTESVVVDCEMKENIFGTIEGDEELNFSDTYFVDPTETTQIV